MTINWPKAFKRTEWPSNSVDYMSEELFNLALFPLREQSGVPMWPSKLFDAHVRILVRRSTALTVERVSLRLPTCTSKQKQS